MKSSQAKRGSIFLLGTQCSRMITQLASIAILSQILSPEIFGLVAMATAVVGIAAIVGDFGLSISALAGVPPDQNQRTKLFLANAFIGTAMTLVVALSAPLLAGFYGEPELAYLTLGIAPIFLINACSVQFKVEMNIAQRWKRLAATEALSPVAGLAVGVVTAVATHSYWALIAQQLTTSIVQLLLAVMLSGWKPVRPDRSSGINSHLKFGRDTLASQTFNYVSSNIDNVAVGHSLGTAALGEYSRAYQLAAMPVAQLASPLTRALVPSLSLIVDDSDFKEKTLTYQRILIYLLLPPISLLVASSTPLVEVALGSQWGNVPGLIQILSAGSCLHAVGYIYYWAFLARRKTAILLITESVSRVLLILLIVTLVSHGTEAVALCVVVGHACLLIGSYMVAPRVIPVDSRRLARQAFRPIIAFGMAATLSITASRYLALDNSWSNLAVSVFTWCACVAFVATIPYFGVRRDISQVLASIRTPTRAK